MPPPYWNGSSDRSTGSRPYKHGGPGRGQHRVAGERQEIHVQGGARRCTRPAAAGHRRPADRTAARRRAARTRWPRPAPWIVASGGLVPRKLGPAGAAHQLGPLVDQRRQVGQVELAGGRVEAGQPVVHPPAEPGQDLPAHRVPGHVVGVVLHHRRDHVVAVAELGQQRVHDRVDGLGRAAVQRDAGPAGRADEPRRSCRSDSSNRAVISAAAARPCGMLPYRAASDRYSPVSSRGGCVLAVLSATTRPVAGNPKCLRIARTSRSPFMVATPSPGAPCPGASHCRRRPLASR